MPRDGAGAKQRLQEAALTLFTEQSYEQTTAAQIAARAGVTERTFFRHFADKREALFAGQERLETALVAAVEGSATGQPPMVVLRAACQALVPLLEQGDSFARPRQQLIAATPALQERERAKLAHLADALAVALTRRGVRPARSRLAAIGAVAAWEGAVLDWYAGSSLGLSALIDQAFDDLIAVSRP